MSSTARKKGRVAIVHQAGAPAEQTLSGPHEAPADHGVSVGTRSRTDQPGSLCLLEEITGSFRRQLLVERLVHLVLPPVMRYPEFIDYKVSMGA
jgi:hypothetical protein